MARNGRRATQASSFFVQWLGLLLNWAFTWVLTGRNGRPRLVAAGPGGAGDAAVTFGLNRLWVFA